MASNPLQVLLVEDETATRQRLQSVVTAIPGFAVAAAVGTLAQALAYAAEEKLDMALVDLNLPDGSGISLIQSLKRTGSFANSLPVEILVISVLGDEHNVLRAIEAGAGGYLLKDASDAEIAAALLQLHAGGAPLSPSIAVHLMRRLQPTKTEASANQSEHHLSDKEVQMLRLIAKGLRYEEVGAVMGLRYNTVASYAKEIYRKLQVSGRAEAVYEATQLGLMGTESR